MSGPCMNNSELQAIADRYFDRLYNISKPALEMIRPKILEKFLSRSCKGNLPQSNIPEKIFIHSELDGCIEETLTELWNLIQPEERLEIRFPGSHLSREKPVDIPNKGKGTLVRQELTRQFGIMCTFKMADGSFFAWEFFD